MDPAGDIRIGVSGWRYPPWRGAFYPRGLAQRRELEFASRALRSIEINGSFYSLQRPQSYAAWHNATPDDFVFAVKGPRFVTHMLRLRGVEAALANFFASGLARLRTKIGPLLWQLPPSMRYDEPLLLHFLSQLPRDTDEAARLARGHNDKVAARTAFDFAPGHPLRHALEVRDESFVNAEFIAMLRDLDIALVVADTGGRWPEYADLTSDFVYVRLHGASELYASGYSPGAIARWARRIERWSHGEQAHDVRVIDPGAPVESARRDVFCFFDNTAKKHAPENARGLMRQLPMGLT
ncbi:MAG: DUF72 domain-containing protein [Betaproteobacteria bacterium]